MGDWLSTDRDARRAGNSLSGLIFSDLLTARSSVQSAMLLTCPRKFPRRDVESAQPEGAGRHEESRFTEAQIIGMIKEQEAGLPTSDLCRKHGLSPATFYKLKAKYGGMDLSDAKRLKQLEDENAKLKACWRMRCSTTSCSRIFWESPDDADATAGRGAAGDEGSSDLSTPCLRSDRCRSKTVRRERPPDNPEIREEMHRIAEKRRRFGYRRVGILLERKGMIMNEKKLYRIYREEGLSVRRRRGRKRGARKPNPMPMPLRPNQRWSLDFLSDTFGACRKFRILAVNDDCCRENLALIADTSISGVRVARKTRCAGQDLR